MEFLRKRLKQYLKSYLRRKFRNILHDDFLLKGSLEETQELKELRNELQIYRDEDQNYKNDLLQIKNLYMFTDDMNDMLKESVFAIQINQSYLINANSRHKKVVYTCITGGYDDLPLYPYLDYDYDYICFTDNQALLNMKNFGAWQIRPLIFSKLGNTKNARWHKIHPHVIFPDYEESIWIDANISVKSDWIFKLVEEKKNANKILVPIHYERDSIFADIEFVVNVVHKETRENADRVIAFLKEHNFPENYGLNETNLIFRKHNDSQIISLMDDWWYFIENYSKRDQFSFSYVLFKHGIKPAEIAIPNLRPLYNSFRIGVIHRQQSVFTEPEDFSFPEYTKTERQFDYAVETKEQYLAYYRRAGWIALDEDFDVYIKANKQFYKANKVMRQDVMNSFKLSRCDVGFDIRISFFDAGEGELMLYIVSHTRKGMYIRGGGYGKWLKICLNESFLFQPRNSER